MSVLQTLSDSEIAIMSAMQTVFAKAMKISISCLQCRHLNCNNAYNADIICQINENMSIMSVLQTLSDYKITIMSAVQTLSDYGIAIMSAMQTLFAKSMKI